jgi:hypothetical protein
MPTQGLFLTADWTDPSGLFEANTSVRRPDHRFWKLTDDSGNSTNSDIQTPQFVLGDSVLVGVHLENAPVDTIVTLNVGCALAKTQPAGSTPNLASPFEYANGNVQCLFNELGLLLDNTVNGHWYKVTIPHTLFPDPVNPGHSNRYEIAVVATAASTTAGISRQFSYDPDMDVAN